LAVVFTEGEDIASNRDADNLAYSVVTTVVVVMAMVVAVVVPDPVITITAFTMVILFPEGPEVNVVSTLFSGPEWLKAHFIPELWACEFNGAVFHRSTVLLASEAGCVAGVVCNVDRAHFVQKHIKFITLYLEVLVLTGASEAAEVVLLPEVVEVIVLWVVTPEVFLTHEVPERNVLEVFIAIPLEIKAVLVDFVALTDEVISDTWVVSREDVAVII
jgi:hypothetical protein